LGLGSLAWLVFGRVEINNLPVGNPFFVFKNEIFTQQSHFSDLSSFVLGQVFFSGLEGFLGGEFKVIVYLPFSFA